MPQLKMGHAAPFAASKTQPTHPPHPCQQRQQPQSLASSTARPPLATAAPRHLRRRSWHCRSSLYDNPALYTNDDQFSEASYWDTRYRNEVTSFEWYRGYASLRALVTRYLPPSLPILQLGMGNSTIQNDMVEQDNYARILNVDYSAVAVAQQAKANAGTPQLEFMVADARNMKGKVADAAFAGVLDKGTLDALLCGEDDQVDAFKLLSEACRVLEPGAVYLHITHAPPSSRLRYLQDPRLPWASIDVWEVGQQGRSHGPYSVPTTVPTTAPTTAPTTVPTTVPTTASGTGAAGGPSQGGQEQAIPVAKEPYSHWVFACRKRIEACGLH